jgi:hypothetical protein
MRKNAKGANMSAAQREALARRYKATHWGVEPDLEVVVDDDALPAGLVQMGYLDEIEIDVPGKGGGSMTIIYPREKSHLAFTHDKAQRLYPIGPPAFRAWAKKTLWKPHAPTYLLSEAAKGAPGRQNRYPYPQVPVQALGFGKHVVYHTHKKGDGPSDYIHELGEDTGKRPLICVDADGRLWFAGGNYKVLVDGIVD